MLSACLIPIAKSTAGAAGSWRGIDERNHELLRLRRLRLGLREPPVSALAGRARLQMRRRWGALSMVQSER